jgi:hypothetical protein
MLLAVVIFSITSYLELRIYLRVRLLSVEIITANGPAVKLVYVAERMKAGAEKLNRGRSPYQPE